MAGTSNFLVSNKGCGSIKWQAEVTGGGDWLTITSGAEGVESGYVKVSYTQHISAYPRSGKITLTAEGANSSPLEVTITQVSAQLPSFPKQLLKGYNSFAPALHLAYLASDCIDDIQNHGISCTQVIRFDSGQGSWETYDTNPDLPPSLKDDFVIEDGQGYFAYCTDEGTWNQRGEQITSPLVIHINQGYTSFSLPPWADWPKRASDIYQAGGDGIKQVIRFNREETAWSTYDPNPQLPQDLWNDFDLEPGVGYFVYSTAGFDWKIARPHQVSNITTSMFTISWLTSQAVKGKVRYRKKGTDAWFTAEDDRGTDWVGETHYLTIQGVAEGIYEYDLLSDDMWDDNGSAHYQVELTNIGMPPLSSSTSWGKVFEPDGKTTSPDSIVYLYLKDIDPSDGNTGESAWLSGIHQDAYWGIEKSIVRSKDLKNYYYFKNNGYEEHIIVKAYHALTAEKIISPANDSPVSDLILSSSPESQSTAESQNKTKRRVRKGDEDGASLEGINQEEAEFQEIMVSNKTSGSFTLSWISNLPCKVVVHYGSAPDNLPFMAYDIRGKETISCTHYIKLIDLQQDTVYYYEIRMNGKVKVKNQVKLPSVIGLPDFTTLAYGWIIPPEGAGLEEAIIYLSLKDEDKQGSMENQPFYLA